MPPAGRVRPSPIDRFTDASPTAVTSGFSAAMALGPQPKLGVGALSEGADWLRNLQKAAGMNGQEFPLDGKVSGVASGISGGGMGEDEELSEDDDGDSEDDSLAPSGKRKAKKGKAKPKVGKAASEDSSAAQRKAQNRIAQREFRQRKQQYIRALEARVELLSSDHDTQVNRLRYALRGLLAENNQLRSLLGCTTAFIGAEMLGGPLQRAGMSRKELESIISSSSEKTMTETWEKWPGAKECDALRQIRLDSNLPPEGLPESHRLSRPANGNAAPDIQTEQDATSNDKRSASKRKMTGDDDEVDNRSKRTQTTSLEDESPNTQSVSSLQSQPFTSIAPGLAQTYEKDPNALLASFFSQTGLPGVASEAAGYNGLTSSPSFGGMNMISPSSQTADSNAILASLFGVNGIGNLFEKPSPNYPQLLSSQTYSDNASGANGARQKTIANVEEPEEIRRIVGLATKLRSGESPFGDAKDETELSEVVEGISQLVHQMATFRRQPSYQLPTLLEPSDVQQTRPHDPLIDALPFPGLRQRLIMTQDSVIVDDVLLSLLYNLKLHQGDSMDASNWEIKENFIYSHGQLIDRDTLAIINAWRTSRKQPTINLSDIPAHLS